MKSLMLRIVLVALLSGASLLGLYAVRSLEGRRSSTNAEQPPTASLSDRAADAASDNVPDKPSAVPASDSFAGVATEAETLENLLEGEGAHAPLPR